MAGRRTERPDRRLAREALAAGGSVPGPPDVDRSTVTSLIMTDTGPDARIGSGLRDYVDP
jgi:hypothetical protein